MGRILSTTPSAPCAMQTVTLGATQFRVRFTWRERTASWYLDLYDAAEEPLALGRRLSPGWGPLIGLSVPDGPAGFLFVRGPEPYVREQLGGAVRVIFYTAAALPAVVEDEDAVTIVVA